jgi:branched-chain amino acid aminotransferase
MSVFYIDGEFVNDHDAYIPATDLAVMRGYGVFDFLRTYNGQPFELEAHVQRLRNSAGLIELDVPWSDDDIASIVHQTLARNPREDGREQNVRIIVTGGPSANGLMPLGESRLLVMVTPATPIPPEHYAQGVKVITERIERYIPDAKTLNYIPAIKAMKRAARENAVEAIYVDREGRALEGTTTNLFAFYGDTLVTPSAGILPGITRGVVLRLARPLFNVQERSIPLDELLRADEVFISASNKQIMPVVKVDDTTIADGKPGPRTRRVMDAFGALTGEPLAV